MAPNPLAELRAAHPELGISDPPTREDWEKFRDNEEWDSLYNNIREAKRKQLEEAYGGKIPKGLCW